MTPCRPLLRYLSAYRSAGVRYPLWVYECPVHGGLPVGAPERTWDAAYKLAVEHIRGHAIEDMARRLGASYGALTGRVAGRATDQPTALAGTGNGPS